MNYNSNWYARDRPMYLFSQLSLRIKSCVLKQTKSFTTILPSNTRLVTAFRHLTMRSLLTMSSSSQCVICPKKVGVTVACRGSWMPGANEALGCPEPTRFLDARGRASPEENLHSQKKNSIHLKKFLTTFFIHLPNFLHFSRKILQFVFKNFWRPSFSHLPYIFT